MSSARWCCGREQRRGRGPGRERRGREGVRGIAEGVQGDEGTARQAAAGVARRGAVAVFSSAFWQEEEDARALGGLASWAGQISGLSKPGGVLSLHFYFISLFYFVILFWALLKILRHTQKSPNCSWPLFGIYPTWNISV